MRFLGVYGQQPVPGLVDKNLQGPVRVCGVHAGEQGDRQGQAAGQFDGHLVHGCARVGGCARRQAPEQGLGLRGGKDVQGDRLGAGVQVSEIAAAGHQDQAPGRRGQQRGHLRGTAGVIQDQQRFLVGHTVAPVPDPLLHGGRKVTGVHPGRGQQSAQRLERLNGVGARSVTVQVDEQLPVRKSASQLARDMYGQGGLADPRHPVDSLHPTLDGHHAPALGVDLIDQRGDGLNLFTAAGECRRVRRQRGADLIRGRRQRMVMLDEDPTDRFRARAHGMGCAGGRHLHSHIVVAGTDPGDRQSAVLRVGIPGVRDAQLVLLDGWARRARLPGSHCPSLGRR